MEGVGEHDELYVLLFQVQELVRLLEDQLISLLD